MDSVYPLLSSSLVQCHSWARYSFRSVLLYFGFISLSFCRGKSPVEFQSLTEFSRIVLSGIRFKIFFSNIFVRHSKLLRRLYYVHNMRMLFLHTRIFAKCFQWHRLAHIMDCYCIWNVFFFFLAVHSIFFTLIDVLRILYEF